MNIFEGVKSFCKEANIGQEEGSDAKIIVQRKGELPFEEDLDPLNGVKFD